MFPISHIGLVYLFGKSVKTKKLWAGMIASVIPDIALIIVRLLAFVGFNLSFISSHPLNLFLHSIFPLLLFLPLAIFGRWYFYSSTIGYSFHLLLDYLTHSAIRMPFYPISNWKLPIFLVSYIDINFTLIINIIITSLLVILFGKKIMMFLKRLFYHYRIERIWLLHVIYVSLVLMISVFYLLFVIVISSPISFLIIPFVTINIYFIGILFALEVYQDDNLKSVLGKIFIRILVETE